MFAKPTSISFAQYGTSPHRSRSRLRSPAFASLRTTGRVSVGAAFQGNAGRLFLPGGRVGPGEQPEAALLREIVEEAGWTARILGAIGRATQLVFAKGPGFPTLARRRLCAR